MQNAGRHSLVVIPTYDEADNILSLVERVLALPELIHVLVIDDNSSDGTGDLVEERGNEESRLHLIRRAGKLGLGTAYLAGFRYALENDYHRVFTMDADFSHNPRYIPAMLALMETHDMVIGSRYVRGGSVTNWPMHRRLLSRFANFYARRLLSLPVRDCTSGFRCHSAAVLQAVDSFGIRSSGYSFLEEMVLRVSRHGFRIGEIPITFENRTAGSSKIDSSEIYRAAWHVLVTALRPSSRTIVDRVSQGKISSK
ncbi:MAG: polyprenol monophosphomannose synthase [Myxococcales bacterium]|jgi:dolichol-phosphate mannosyltransferase|nr:polyprenol monophosphomannose synthase [Myxococcales bacterium]